MRPLKCPVPDFDKTTQYHIVYDPQKEEFNPVQFSEKFEEKNWCGVISRFEKGIGCYHVFNFFNKGPVIASWFLADEPNSNEAKAVCLNKQWHLLEEGEYLIISGDKNSYALSGKMSRIHILVAKQGEDLKILLEINRE